MNIPYHPSSAQLKTPAPHRDNVGELLLDAGKLTESGAERVLELQKYENLRFGEAAIKLGLISEADLCQALSQQFSYPYLPPGKQQFAADLVAAYKPFGPQAERLRALRNQLMLRWFAAGHSALTIAGIDAGDGASYVAANLAVAFSQLGERTLLIDADLRQPRQHLLFKLGNRPGLSDMLAGRAGMEAVTAIADVPNLALLTSGAIPPNPAELLSRASAPIKLEDFAAHYSVILIDTPPARDSADAVVVAARTTGALLVVRKNHTHLADATAFQTNLDGAGAALIGTVLNQF